MERKLKRWFVRQFLPSRSHAWPARESVKAVAVAVFGFGIVFVLGGECVERPVVGCVFDGGHVLAECVAVDVVRASVCHRVTGHVVDGDGVLVGFGLVVALVDDFTEYEGIDIEGELLGLCAFLCRLVRTNRDDTGCYKNNKTFNYVEWSVGKQDIAVHPHQLDNSLHFQSIHIQDIE